MKKRVSIAEKLTEEIESGNCTLQIPSFVEESDAGLADSTEHSLANSVPVQIGEQTRKWRI
jgi:hypothetical protein